MVYRFAVETRASGVLRSIRAVLVLFVLSNCTALFCAKVQAQASSANDEQKALFDGIWKSSVLIGNKKSEVFPFVALRGRYHGQIFSYDGKGASGDGAENRRIRLGLDAVFTKKLALSFEFDIGRESGDDFIQSFDYLSLSYAFDNMTKLSFGKLRRSPLTREDSTSGNTIITMERSLLTSRYFVDNLSGAYIEHKTGDWTFGGGVFKGSIEEDLGLPSFKGASLFHGNITKQLSDVTELRLDYMHNPGDANNNGLEPFRHVLSLNSLSRLGPWGLVTDLIYAAALKEARGDLFGVVIMPHYMLTERLQLVGRYTWSGSNEENGIRLLNRYDRRAVPQGSEFGDRHQEFYAGLNYYFYGHKLKLMSGVSYTDFKSIEGDTSVITASAAFRIYF